MAEKEQNEIHQGGQSETYKQPIIMHASLADPKPLIYIYTYNNNNNHINNNITNNEM